MSLPSSKPAGQQSSIRSFFRPPKAPTYAPPPSSSSTVPPPPPPAPRPSQQTSSALPIPPIAPPVTAATNPALPREATIRAIEDADLLRGRARPRPVAPLLARHHLARRRQRPPAGAQDCRRRRLHP
ncbi:hypothetical protein PWT90_11187 [Aphanocladium album]|nr:hypothetical protein PWT90_11187 [Aphanocladium album]